MLYGLSILLSSFLLFQVQLILGKFLLPWFGGTSSVWTTCMLFFQCMLLLGYAYSFALDRIFKKRAQAILHILVITVAIGVVWFAYVSNGSPIFPGSERQPIASGESPILEIVRLLVASIGLPFLILAANSPLIQRWYSLGQPKSPYRLYALSNVGSLLGLITYPFVVEPNIGLEAQANIWATAFGLFCLFTVACAILLLKTPASVEPQTTTEQNSRNLSPGFTLLLAACPACLLLAVTNELCQEIAVAPFLWVLPLAIYLLTFIISFDRPIWYQRTVWIPLTYATTIIVLITSIKGIHLGIVAHTISYSAFLFSICITCHGELYRLRPDATRLTSFYLIIATGGVIGSALVAIIAPTFFNGYWEFTLALVGTLAGLAWLFWKDRSSFLHTGSRLHFHLFVLLVCYVGMHYTAIHTGLYKEPLIAEHKELFNLIAASLIASSISLAVWRKKLIQHPVWPRLLIIGLLLIAECFALFDLYGSSKKYLLADRNFYGTIRVGEIPESKHSSIQERQLIHGNIVHGSQILSPEFELLPTKYYCEDSGIGRAIRNHPRRINGESIHLGVTGLGVGAITSLVGEGDAAAFFEINPLVSQLAHGPDALFTYINKSPADISLYEGDARIRLESLLGSKGSMQFDVLALDAFTSDAIPTHLLTREAFEVYKAHLRDKRSIIAVNISNRFLDLESPVCNIAESLGFKVQIVYSFGASRFASLSNWILLSQAEGFDQFLDSELTSLVTGYRKQSDLIWTDDFSNLWEVLK